MRDVFVIGAGQTPVGEHWGLGLRELGAAAIRAALDDCGIETVDALFVGNMLGGTLNGQENLGALLADAAGLLPAEAWKVEAACASGGAAVRAAALSVAAGAHDVVVAVGLEKMTDAVSDQVTAGLDRVGRRLRGEPRPELRGDVGPADAALHARDRGGPQGLRPVRGERPPERRVERQCHVPRAHLGRRLPPLTPGGRPIGVLDAAPVCDGAAAVVICSREALRPHQRPVRIAAAAAATDTIGLAGRADLLTLEAARRSAEKAYAASGFGPKDLDFFEAHDAFTIITALSLEACGFVPRGEALKRAAHGCFAAGGCVPISTFGGLKARGHPVGASGTYQIVEAATQLRGEAGPNQVPNARVAMTQSIGGHGSIAVTHVLEA